MYTSEDAKLFWSLSELTRLRILELLNQAWNDNQALHSGLIATQLGISPSVASHHLTILEDSNLVLRIRSGKYVSFVPKAQGFEKASKLLTQLKPQSTLESKQDVPAIFHALGEEGRL